MTSLNIQPDIEVNQGVENSATYRMALGDLSQKEIVQLFSSLSQEGRQIVIPIGFPKAGKSLFLSSLMFYSHKNTEKRWSPTNLSHFPFDQGNLSRDLMVHYFEDGQAYLATKSGTLDLIGVDIKPAKSKLPTLPLAFVDLAGEDLEDVKTSSRGEFTDQIDGILKACCYGSPIFCLITPFAPTYGHDAENTLHADFINYIEVNHPRLYNMSKFIVIVSQWDRKGVNDKIDVETYIKKFRPSLYNKITSSKAQIVYGEYSIGDVTSVKDENKVSVDLITNIRYDYPHNFWNQLYTLSTGKSLTGGFWEKLLGI